MAITHPHSPSIANSPAPPSSKSNNNNGNKNITLLPVTKADLPSIALLEHLAFEEDEFSDLAFGKERGSPEALKMRERQFEKFLEKAERGGEEEGGWYCKAVLRAEDGGREEIVGIAGWSLGGGEEMRMGREKVKGGEIGEKEGSVKGMDGEAETRIKTKEELEEIWGKGSNVQLCEDVFVRGDEYMYEACGGEKWLKLNILVIHPSYQRRGIGTLLLEQGLKLADEKSLQVVLGASPWGIGLYRKYGFVDVHCMDVHLDRYEGGEGMGSTRHVIMRRPPGGRE
ncbi:hypothetical protein EAE96_005381 [Botrytis aclada]|nr:hypothetical protein EAE96_005381 [Botrytis aclada]